jgi:hypothetical protein
VTPRPAILERLRGVRRAGNGWLAFCASHPDHHKRSLSVGIGDDGRTLLNCHAAAGCTAESITRAVNMTLADLAPTGGRRNGHDQPPRREIASYNYCDARGELLYQVVRFEPPKDFRCRRPDGGGWAWNLHGVRVVPYRLPELAEAQRVYIPEGEKDVDALFAAGLIATCNHAGAGAWRQEHTAALVAAAVTEVVILPDNDPAGDAHGHAVARACAAAGLAVKLLRLPNLPAKGDVSDWFGAGNGRDELEALADQAPLFTAADPLGTDTTHQPKMLIGTQIISVRVAEPDWTIERLFSHAHQHMIVGASQGAKTWTLSDLAVAVAHDDVGEFLGQRVVRHGRVVLESWEQGQAEDVRKIQKLLRGRGLASCSDNLILLSDAPSTLSDETYYARRLTELREWRAIAYLIDSLSEAAGVELNDNTAYSAWWRSRVKPILDLGCMVVFTHLKGHVKPGVGQNRDSASRGATQIRALSVGAVEMRQLTPTSFKVLHNKHRNGLALPFGAMDLEGGLDDDFVRLVITAEAGAAEGKDLLARRLLTALGERQPPGAWLDRKTIEASLNDRGKPKDERVSKKTWEPVLTTMTEEGLFEQQQRRNADVWRWTFQEANDPDDEPGLF